MNLDKEFKRLEYMEAWLQLYSDCETRISVAKSTLKQIAIPNDFGNIHEFYTKRLKILEEMKPYIEKRYKQTLNN